MLTIANFQANYYLPRGAPDAATLRKRLDRLVQQRLPQAVGKSLQPPASDAEAVYRIRHLEIDLWIDALQNGDGEIAQRWARLLLEAVVRTLLLGSPDNVVRYVDHAHFLAAFLGDLLNGRAWSRWMYAEFTPLRNLPVGQVAAHLLAPRPELLAPVAQRLAHHHQLEPLLQQMGAADLHLIWAEGLGFRALPTVPPATPLRDRVLATLGDGVVLARGDGAVQRRNALRLYLHAVMTHPELAGNATLGAVCQHLVRLHQLWAAHPAPALWQALARREIGAAAAIAPLLTELDSPLSTARDWLVASLATAEGRAYLAQLVPHVAPGVNAARPTMATKPTQPEPLRAHRVATSFAGLALLLPSIRALGLHRQMDAAARYQLLLMLVGRTQQPLAWGDAAPTWLAGLSEREAERARAQAIHWPDVTQWEDADSLTQLATDAADELGPLPGSVVAARVLRHFAQGLRGFADSSPGYLIQQFVHAPGHMERTDDALHVHVGRLSLGIVLHMAGRTEEQGEIPWLDDRTLWIHLPE